MSQKIGKVWKKCKVESISNEIQSNDELVIFFTKDLILKNMTVQEDVKWNNIKILDKDEYNKYLLYVNCSSKNTFGVLINSNFLVAIKLSEKSNEYSYKMNPKFYLIQNVEEIENDNIIDSAKIQYSWDKEILYEEDFKEKYQFKNILKNIKEMILGWINDCKKAFLYIKEHKMLKNGIIILCIIFVVIFANSLRRENVPYLVGKTVDEARQIIKNYNLELDVDSAGDSSEIIKKQYPESGRVKLKTTISVSTDEYFEMINKPSNETIVACAKTLISEGLKSSTTARWEKDCQVVDKDDYGRYLVYISVEAQNGFGAYVKLAYFVILQSVNKSGEFTYRYFNSIEASQISGYYNPIELYKEGNINTNLQYLMNANNWNQELNNEEENNN